jgi:myo-inositol-1(or 4)-monophosphatase
MEPMLNIALNAAREVGEMIVRQADNLGIIEVQEKSLNDFVSEVDKAAEQQLIEKIRKFLPDHHFQGEEQGEVNTQTNSEYLWVIDPLDGTTNFLRGVPHYAVSLACFKSGKLEHAVVLNPITREEFTASRGKGARLNGKRIRVSSRKSLEGALIGTGIPFHQSQHDYLDAYGESLKAVAKKTAGVRRAGSAALDLAYVAAGRFDGFWEIGLKPWDIAAGILLVQEAGGLTCDFKGGHSYLETGNIISATPKCLKPLMQLLKPHLSDI